MAEMQFAGIRMVWLHAFQMIDDQNIFFHAKVFSKFIHPDSFTP